MSEGPATRVLVTGSAGFIGFHLARMLLDQGCAVHGYDNLNPYYDVGLKRDRHAALRAHPRFTASEADLLNERALRFALDAFRPEVIVHLAAQAGVRYSLENPRAFLDANVTGTFNLLEAARTRGLRHLLIASTSSVYGAQRQLPFAEDAATDTPLTLYAATKQAGEAMAHAYAHLHGLPVTLFRFFTAYGPWGRPDMAPFRFVEAIRRGRPIELYNRGEMWRDFTYVTDLVEAVRRLIAVVPVRPAAGTLVPAGDSLSPVAPWRVVNIGQAEPVRLTDFVTAIEDALGMRAQRTLLPMQPGDMAATCADTTLLHRLTGYRPQTGYREGVARLVEWHRSYYPT